MSHLARFLLFAGFGLGLLIVAAILMALELKRTGSL